jgi:Flp pilus assembly protein CpaB
LGAEQQVGPRRTSRGLVSRFSTGHVVMVVAGLLGAILTLSVLRSADDARPVLVAARDVVPGTMIDAGTLRTARVDASDQVLASLYAPEDLDDLEGRVATAPIAAGGLVTRDVVQRAEAGAAVRSMSFPIAAAHAMGGVLDTGDHVDILAVERDGADAGYVMTDVEVLAVDNGHGGPLGTPENITVTIAVDSDGAVRLASALERGTVTLVRSTGAAPIAHAASEGHAPSGSAAAAPERTDG